MDQQFRPTKAMVSAALTALVVFVSVWTNDSGSFTSKEIADAIVTALVASGLVGLPTYAVKNKPRP